MVTAAPRIASDLPERLFEFNTVWRIPVPLITAWNHIGRVTQYPTWWPGIETVQLVQGQELPIAVGTVAHYTVRSPLYTLHYQTEVLEFDTGTYILAQASGDLAGTGRWVFDERPDYTQATFQWRVAVTPLLLRTAARLPLVPSVMRYFHNQLMSAGERGLQQLFAQPAAEVEKA